MINQKLRNEIVSLHSKSIEPLKNHLLQGLHHVFYLQNRKYLGIDSGE